MMPHLVQGHAATPTTAVPGLQAVHCVVEFTVGYEVAMALASMFTTLHTRSHPDETLST